MRNVSQKIKSISFQSKEELDLLHKAQNKDFAKARCPNQQLAPHCAEKGDEKGESASIFSFIKTKMEISFFFVSSLEQNHNFESDFLKAIFLVFNKR